MKIVIVEDEIRIREGLAKLIRRLFPQVTQVSEAKSGEEGIALIRETKPDIVFTDIRMEPMDGLAMLTHLSRDESLHFKSVILSAYSEFEYAKQAISLGVNEYLIKPVEIAELQRIILQLEKEIQEEKSLRSSMPKQLRSLDNVIGGALSGQLEINEELGVFLAENYHIDIYEPISIVCLYLGSRFEDEKAMVMAMLQNAFWKKGDGKIQLMDYPMRKEILCVIFSIKDQHMLERYLQYTFLPEVHKNSPACVVGYAVCQGLSKLREQQDSLRRVMPWSISLGRDILISYPKVEYIQQAELVYPMEQEKECIAAFYRRDYDVLDQKITSFLQYFTCQPYAPEEIKKSVLRFVWSLVNAAREVNFQAYQNVDEKNIVEAVSQVVTYSEIETIVYMLVETLGHRKEKVVGLIVQKAQRLVEEYYRQGITLEEIALKLGVSPEHVSGQFKKELGVNFSTWYHDYRLEKAKGLLKETDLKVYEVAQRAGYKDAKYFSKVFRSAEGMLPLAYRQSTR